jgi:hypothetical protein
LRDLVGSENYRKLLDSGAWRPAWFPISIPKVRHSVEVEAGSLFEAAVLAMRTFKEHDCEPGLMSNLDVEIRTSVIHTVTPKKVRQWLEGGARSPKDAVLKERLRAML